MRKLFGLLATISVAGVSPVFATDPPSATTTSNTTSTPAETEPSAEAKATPATTSKPADGQVKLIAGDADAAKQLKRLKAAGYKSEVRGAEVVFCRMEPVSGSHFEKKVCNTAEDIEKQMNDAQLASPPAFTGHDHSPKKPLGR